MRKLWLLIFHINIDNTVVYAIFNEGRSFARNFIGYKSR